jgi:hypothetical protein
MVLSQFSTAPVLHLPSITVIDEAVLGCNPQPSRLIMELGFTRDLSAEDCSIRTVDLFSPESIDPTN